MFLIVIDTRIILQKKRKHLLQIYKSTPAVRNQLGKSGVRPHNLLLDPWLEETHLRVHTWNVRHAAAQAKRQNANELVVAEKAASSVAL